MRPSSRRCPRSSWSGTGPNGGGPGRDTSLLRLPELIRRIEDRFPPRGGAPEQPPLPEIELVLQRSARPRSRWLGYLAAALAGGAAVWIGALAGWLG